MDRVSAVFSGVGGQHLRWAWGRRTRVSDRNGCGSWGVLEHPWRKVDQGKGRNRPQSIVWYAALLVFMAAACSNRTGPSVDTVPPEAVTTSTGAMPELLPPATVALETVDLDPGSGPADCPESAYSHDQGCHPVHTDDPPETPEEVQDAAMVVVEDLPNPGSCEAGGGAWDEDTGECGPLPTAQDPHSESVQSHDQKQGGEEPHRSGDGARTAGADEVVVQWWRPGLIDEAVALVDPRSVSADDWHLNESERDWGTYRFYRFYHALREDSATERETFWQAIQTVHDVHLQKGGGIYYPFRYDVAWVEYPNRIGVTLTFPLGEAMIVPVIRTDGSWSAEWDVEFPPGPPIRPTTPFTDPRFPETAQALGRDCPPVEQLWRKNQPVEDPCTLKAVQTALEYAESGTLEQRMAAVRDGHVLADLLAAVDNIQDPFIASGMGDVGRATKTIETRAVRWRGGFAQASMILLEWRSVWPVRDLTEEERQAAIRYYEWRAAQGLDVPPDRLRGEFRIGGPTSWFETLMVRTADGTWRQSYREFCHKLDHTIPNFPDYVSEHTLQCPDDPTPHFPDSRFFDQFIPPPNTRLYYVDPRSGDDPNELYRLDRGLYRLGGEYLGVPPS